MPKEQKRTGTKCQKSKREPAPIVPKKQKRTGTNCQNDKKDPVPNAQKGIELYEKSSTYRNGRGFNNSKNCSNE